MVVWLYINRGIIAGSLEHSAECDMRYRWVKSGRGIILELVMHSDTANPSLFRGDGSRAVAICVGVVARRIYYILKKFDVLSGFIPAYLMHKLKQRSRCVRWQIQRAWLPE
jgi:hypothetical protein